MTTLRLNLVLVLSVATSGLATSIFKPNDAGEKVLIEGTNRFPASNENSILYRPDFLTNWNKVLQEQNRKASSRIFIPILPLPQTIGEETFLVPPAKRAGKIGKGKATILLDVVDFFGKDEGGEDGGHAIVVPAKAIASSFGRNPMRLSGK